MGDGDNFLFFRMVFVGWFGFDGEEKFEKSWGWGGGGGGDLVRRRLWGSRVWGGRRERWWYCGFGCLVCFCCGGLFFVFCGCGVEFGLLLCVLLWVFGFCCVVVFCCCLYFVLGVIFLMGVLVVFCWFFWKDVICGGCKFIWLKMFLRCWERKL